MSEEVLDWKEAMARVLNKRVLYVKLLGKFIETEKNSPARIAQALADGKVDEARNVVHTTKGAAANLGAKALAAVAMEFEADLKNGDDAQASLGRFAAAMDDTLAAMNAFIAE